MIAGGSGMPSTFFVMWVASSTRLESIAGRILTMDPPSPAGASDASDPSIASVSLSNHAVSAAISSPVFVSNVFSKSASVASICTPHVRLSNMIWDKCAKSQRGVRPHHVGRTKFRYVMLFQLFTYNYVYALAVPPAYFPAPLPRNGALSTASQAFAGSLIG